MMFSPSIAVGLLNRIAVEAGCEVELIETAEYSDQHMNRHLRLSKMGANRGIVKTRSEDDYWWIKPESEIVPDFVEMVDRFKPDLILMHVQEDIFSQSIAMLDAIKDRDIEHIVGGVFAIADPDYVMENELIKRLCRFEAEEMLKDAIDAIKTGRSLDTVQGTWYRTEDGTIKKNKPAPLTDISKASPDFSVYADKGVGKRWARTMGGIHFNTSISMETYRGCPYNCTFCNSPTTRDVAGKNVLNIGNFMRRKKADQIERELVELIDKWDVEFITFADDSFLARPAKEIFEFAEMWSKYKIPFWMNTRVENCKPEYLQAMKECGMYRFNMGIESGNEQYRREILKRPVSNDVYYEHFDYVNKSDIPYGLNVIIGMPFETREHVLDTAKMLKAVGGWDGLTISGFQPYRGTELREMALKAGFIPEEYINQGGLLGDDGEWSTLRMPEPYLQHQDIKGLIRTVPLYAFYKEEYWDEVKLAETDDDTYFRLLEDYKEVYYTGELQTGGDQRKNDLKRQQNYCHKHDISSTYIWEEMTPENQATISDEGLSLKPSRRKAV